MVKYIDQNEKINLDSQFTRLLQLNKFKKLICKNFIMKIFFYDLFQ